MKKRRVALIVGILVSCVGLWWALRGVEWTKVREAFSTTRLYAWSVPVAIVTVAGMWLRGARTYFLLRHEARLDQWPLFKITTIGFCYNSILPLRAGEVIRAFLLGKEKGLGFVKAAASLVVERVYDLIAILLCFGFALMSVKIATDMEVDVLGWSLKGESIRPITEKSVYLGVLLIAGILFMLFERTRRLVTGTIERLPALPSAIKEKLLAVVESFSSGLRSVRDPGAVTATLVLSLLNWLSVALSIWLLQFGFRELSGQMSMSESIAFMVVICFAVTLPSGPAYFGMYEAGGVFAFLALGLSQDKSLALSFTLAIHLIQVVSIVALGLFFAFGKHLSVRRIAREAPAVVELVASVPSGSSERS
jgi:uncharacterized protein (TIRG00374 family)